MERRPKSGRAYGNLYPTAIKAAKLPFCNAKRKSWFLREVYVEMPLRKPSQNDVEIRYKEDKKYSAISRKAFEYGVVQDRGIEVQAHSNISGGISTTKGCVKPPPKYSGEVCSSRVWL